MTVTLLHGMLVLQRKGALLFRPAEDAALVMDEYAGRATVVLADGETAWCRGPASEAGGFLAELRPGVFANPRHAREGIFPGGWTFGALPPAPALPTPADPMLGVGVRASCVVYARDGVLHTAEGEVPLPCPPEELGHPCLVKLGACHFHARRLRSLTLEGWWFHVLLDTGQTVAVHWSDVRADARALGLPDPSGRGEGVRAVLYDEELRDWPRPLLEMPAEMLLPALGGDRRRAIANVLWQVVRLRAQGAPPDYGSSHRGFWYLPLRPVLLRLGMLGGTPVEPLEAGAGEPQSEGGPVTGAPVAGEAERQGAGEGGAVTGALVAERLAAGESVAERLAGDEEAWAFGTLAQSSDEAPAFGTLAKPDEEAWAFGTLAKSSDEAPAFGTLAKPSEAEGVYAHYLQVVSTLVGDKRLFTYRELGFEDGRPELRGIGSVRPHVVLIVEKSSLLRMGVEAARRFGISWIVLGGESTLLAVEFFAEALRPVLSPGRRLQVAAYVDFDPSGWNAAETFVGHMARYGLEAEPPRYFVVPSRFTRAELEAVAYPIPAHDEGARKKVREWIRRSGGIDRRGLGIHSDHLRPLERVVRAIGEATGLEEAAAP